MPYQTRIYEDLVFNTEGAVMCFIRELSCGHFGVIFIPKSVTFSHSETFSFKDAVLTRLWCALILTPEENRNFNHHALRTGSIANSPSLSTVEP